MNKNTSLIKLLNFNPRSLAGATQNPTLLLSTATISIHAPSRERPRLMIGLYAVSIFQSTLPRGSDARNTACKSTCSNFNPRSLAGATAVISSSIFSLKFQSTLPRGSDVKQLLESRVQQLISIHAPSRERLLLPCFFMIILIFQSTLPRGSDAGYNLFQSPTLEFQSTLPRGSDL